MSVDRIFGGRYENDAHQPGTAAAPAAAPGRPGRGHGRRSDGRSNGGLPARGWSGLHRTGWSAPGAPGNLPTEVDAALVGVLADYAAAVVHRERTTGRLTDSSTARQVGSALGDAQAGRRRRRPDGPAPAQCGAGSSTADQGRRPHAPAAGGTSPPPCCALVVCRGTPRSRPPPTNSATFL